MTVIPRAATSEIRNLANWLRLRRVFKIVFGPAVNMNDDFWSAPCVTHTWAMSTIFGKAFTSGAFHSV